MRKRHPTTTEQLDFFHPTTTHAMEAFLTQWIALEEDEDRLREAKRALKARYADEFSMRALLTAVKVCRARLKLEAHAREPTPREHQEHFEHLVNGVLVQRQQEQEAALREAHQLTHETTGAGR